jgi:hypothetical protein
MKNLTKTLLFLLIFSQIAFFGCSTDDELKAELLPQLSESTCADLSVEDLDLSAGFRGVYGTITDPELGGFYVRNHSNVYEFDSSVEAGDCDGICAFRVVFEPSVPTLSFDTESIEIANVIVSYFDANFTVTQPVVAWSWSYPNLDIEVVYVNAVTDYTIGFTDSYASELQIADVEVLGGLCVIENIDATDPIYKIRLADKGSHN